MQDLHVHALENHEDGNVMNWDDGEEEYDVFGDE
jgi:hypothetical protein